MCGKDFIWGLNSNSLKIIQAKLKLSLASGKANGKFQFERHGYFVADLVKGLHPGNAVRFGIRPLEFDAWLTKHAEPG